MPRRRQPEPLRSLFHFPRMFGERMPGFRQRHAPANAFHQGDSQALLHGRDLAPDRGLGAAQRKGCGGVGAVSRHREQYAGVVPIERRVGGPTHTPAHGLGAEVDDVRCVSA